MNALGCQRIRELRHILDKSEYSWIKGSILIPKNMKLLNCDQRIILYFNLFRYIYSDSPFIPAIHDMSIVISIAAEMYIM